MNQLLANPAAGIVVSIAAYGVGVLVRDRFRSPLANPLAIGTILVVCFLHLTPMSLEQFRNGGGFVAMFVAPATTALALQIHRQWERFKANILPMVVGCAAGSLVSIGSIAFMCHWLGVDKALAESLKPKSVTTAVAIDLALSGGGVAAITVSAVVFTGIFGAILGPILVGLFRLEGAVEIGIAMGASAHAIGTSRALEMGEVEGAMSGIALIVSAVLLSACYVVFF